MNILVTGATGYLGAEVIRTLLGNCQHNLFALIRNEEKFQRLLQWCNADSKHLIPVKADICKLKQLPPGIDTVIHTAAFRLESNPEKATKVNIDGTNNILDLAMKYGVRRFVYTSSQSIYGWRGAPWSEKAAPNPQGIYATTKHAAEKNIEIHQDRLDYVILRISRMCGVSLFTRWDEVIPKFISLLYQGKPINIYGDGNQHYDFVHVSDVAHFIFKILDMYPQGWNDIYNIGGGRSISLNEIVEYLTSISVEKGLPQVTVLYKPEVSTNSQSHLKLDTTHVRNKSGWIPQREIRDILEEYIRAFPSNYDMVENHKAAD